MRIPLPPDGEPAFRRGVSVLLCLALLFAATGGCADRRSRADHGATDQPGPDPPAVTAAPPPPNAPTPAAPATAPRGGRAGYPWRAHPDLTWQWQLTGRIDTRVDADVFELDGVTTSAAVAGRLRATGRRLICYVNAGAYEDFRPDARRYPAEVLGRTTEWPGERWLDIRRWDRLAPILRQRFQTCRDKGFHAVEADNVDGYTHRSGFPLRWSDQLLFNRRLADLAHSLGLAVGLKNNLNQVAELEPYFDFAVNEECFRYRECHRLAPFRRAGKPIFHVEYDVPAADFCTRARKLGMTSMAKRPALDAWRDHC